MHCLDIPAPRLSAQDPASRTAPAIVSASASAPMADSAKEMSATATGISDFDLYGPGGRGRQFILVRAEPGPDSGFARAVEAIFEPEVVHWGKKTVSCSVLTAIKRKNPLCLLNPIFFQLTW